MNPLKIEVAEFWKVKGCPLAAALRRKMKKARSLLKNLNACLVRSYSKTEALIPLVVQVLVYVRNLIMHPEIRILPTMNGAVRRHALMEHSPIQLQCLVLHLQAW